jgi:hypothetical protein
VTWERLQGQADKWKNTNFTQFSENINILLIAIEILSIPANEFMGTAWN